eukprot:gene20686-23494_t
MPLSARVLQYEEFVIGIASAVGCGLIVLTYLFFPNLRKLRYVELVFYVAINDLMASIGMTFGPSENGSAECWYQGLSSTGNYLSSVFWTSLITYQMYQVVVNEGKVVKNMFYVHCFCWGVPLLLTFIPLSTSTYANPDDEATWCFVADRHNSPPWSQLFWFIVSFYAWLWLAMLCSVYMLVSIVLKLRKLEVVPNLISSTVGKLALYPIIITVCWTVNTIANIYTFSTNKSLNDLNSSWSMMVNLGIVFATLQGFLNAVVFFGMNPLVREHWGCLLYDLYLNIFCCNCGAPIMATDPAENDNKKILADLEAARNSHVSHNSDNSEEQDVTRLNTLRNSTAGLPVNNNNLSMGASSMNRTTTGTGSMHTSTTSKGLKMIQAIESEPDFVGAQSLSSMYAPNTFVSIHNHNNGSTAGGGNGDNTSGSRFDNNGEYLYSVEIVSAPISTLMTGLKKTADGWWETARESSISLSFSTNRNSMRYANRAENGSLSLNNSISNAGSFVEMHNRPSGVTSVINPLSRTSTLNSSLNGSVNSSNRSSFAYATPNPALQNVSKS